MHKSHWECKKQLKFNGSWSFFFSCIWTATRSKPRGLNRVHVLVFVKHHGTAELTWVTEHRLHSGSPRQFAGQWKRTVLSTPPHNMRWVSSMEPAVIGILLGLERTASKQVEPSKEINGQSMLHESDVLSRYFTLWFSHSLTLYLTIFLIVIANRNSMHKPTNAWSKKERKLNQLQTGLIDQLITAILVHKHGNRLKVCPCTSMCMYVFLHKDKRLLAWTCVCTCMCVHVRACVCACYGESATLLEVPGVCTCISHPNNHTHN